MPDKFKEDEKKMADIEAITNKKHDDTLKMMKNRRKDKQRKRIEEKKGLYSRETQKHLKKSLKKKMATLNTLLEKKGVDLDKGMFS